MCEPLHSWNHRTFGLKSLVTISWSPGDHRWSIFNIENMLTQNMSYVADHSGSMPHIWKLQACRASGYAASNCSPHGRRNANVHTGDAAGSAASPVHTLAFLLPPATAPCMNESALLTERLPPYTTLLTSTKPANLQNADKESSAEEDGLDDKFGAEDNGPSEGYTFFGCRPETRVASGSCCLNCDWWPVHATGPGMDVEEGGSPAAIFPSIPPPLWSSL